MSLSTSLTSAAAAAAAELRASMRGAVLVPTDAPYDGARRIWNGVVDRQPAVIARCTQAQDVVVAVRVAREHGLPLSVRGGGHDWAGRSLRDGGVLIDMSSMRGVTVHTDTLRAEVQGGATSGDLVGATTPHGLVPVTGTIRQVGMAGITMGGGYGLLNGCYGLALDNLLAADLVLADGSRVTASTDENPDLFWAIRGGGGNFGVVTGLRYRLYPVSSILAGMVLYPHAEGPDVLRRYRELVADSPDELSVITGFFGGPDGEPVAILMPAWNGDRAVGERIFDGFLKWGHPVSVQLGPMTLPEVLALLDEHIVDGLHNETRNHWMSTVDDEAIDLLVTGAAHLTSPYSALAIHQFHGASSRVPAADTAWALRRDHLLLEIISTWDPDDDATPHRRWAREMREVIAPHALPGGYPNLLGPDETDRVLLAFGANAPRLLELKRRYDPDGVFTAVPTLPVPAPPA
jgi:hypothetical protein